MPPNVWLHGSQSTITGVVRNGQHAARLSWFDVSMRWVLTTPLGAPVEPEVNSTLAIVSGVIWANARSSAGERGVRASCAAGSSSSAPSGPSVPCSVSAANAGPNHTESSANTKPGRSCAATSRSRRKLVDCSEYADDTGATGTPACIAPSPISAAAMLLSDRIITGRSAVAPRSSRLLAMPSTEASASPYDSRLHPPAASRSARNVASGVWRAQRTSQSPTQRAGSPGGTGDSSTSPPGVR